MFGELWTGKDGVAPHHVRKESVFEFLWREDELNRALADLIDEEDRRLYKIAGGHELIDLREAMHAFNFRNVPGAAVAKRCVWFCMALSIAKINPKAWTGRVSLKDLAFINSRVSVQDFITRRVNHHEFDKILREAILLL